MINHLVAGLLVILGVIAGDLAVHPRSARPWRLRSVPGMAILVGWGALVFGIYLAITGALVPAMVLVFLSLSIFPLISNIKRQVLGEPLVFTDLALIGAVFQHPHFYLCALKLWQIVTIVVGIAALVAVVGLFSTADLGVRAIGAAIALAAAGVLKAMAGLWMWAALAQRPDINRDVRDHGLIATLFVYWRLWLRLPRRSAPALPVIAGDDRQHLVMIVQFESYCDPAEVFGMADATLAGLAKARSQAWSRGRLMVSGFGAYTMRTEFGALFGIDHDELGLRQFDPFLTAASSTNVSLPRRLGDNWSTVFVHPHDLRFYGRDRLMPAAGFDTLIGEEGFLTPERSEGRYVTDAALCDKLIEIATATVHAPTLVYTVTIENHGPWSSDESTDPEGNKHAYLRLLEHSDAMLVRLLEQLPKLGRPSTLCFFGDHRPSIPKVCTPGGDRHTPFVIVKLDAQGNPVPSTDPPKDLTPAQLHHEILRAISSR